ncbi:MAG: hypothetical protein M3142_01815 [Bacteroidota bacterium]|nr:hypothetical protein [Bacteroidota bacterium]
MKESNRESKLENCKEEINNSFNGVIRRVKRFEYDEYMKDHSIVLDIVPDSGISITYQFYYENAIGKLNFIEDGDKVIKHKNSKLFFVIKKNGHQKAFMVPLCE